MRFLKQMTLTLLLGILCLGCHSDSLSIQTEFPFTISSSVLPTAVKAGQATEFQITIVPTRLTTSSTYKLTWRNLTVQAGELSVAPYGVIAENKAVEVSSLAPTLRFTAPAAGQNSFLILVEDQNGVSQQLTVALTTQ